MQVVRVHGRQLSGLNLVCENVIPKLRKYKMVLKNMTILDVSTLMYTCTGYMIFFFFESVTNICTM